MMTPRIKRIGQKLRFKGELLRFQVMVTRLKEKAREFQIKGARLLELSKIPA